MPACLHIAARCGACGSWVGGVGDMCKCVYLHVSACVRVYVRTLVMYVTWVCVCENEASEPHKIAQGYHIPFLLQKTRLAMLCDLVGWRMGAPSRPGLQLYLIDSGSKERKRGSGGEEYLKPPVSSSPLVLPVHKGSHLPNLKEYHPSKNTDQTHTSRVTQDFIFIKSTCLPGESPSPSKWLAV